MTESAKAILRARTDRLLSILTSLSIISIAVFVWCDNAGWVHFR